MKYVGFWKRFLAYMTDLTILMVIYISLHFSFARVELGQAKVIAGLLNICVGVGYFIFFWSTQNGQTLGQRLMAIRVIKENGKKMDLPTSVLRYIGYIISSFVFCLGFIWIGFDKKKQGWHDKIAKTFVVETKEKPHTKMAFAIAFIPLLLVVLAFGVVILAFIAGAKDPQGVDRMRNLLSNYAPTLTQSQTQDLEDRVFEGMSAARQQRGFTPLTQSNTLCAYAQRRIEQIESLGRYDDDKGFYEDAAKPDMRAAYFVGYQTAGELYKEINSVSKPTAIVQALITSKNNSVLFDKKKDEACVRVHHNNLFAIFGGK